MCDHPPAPARERSAPRDGDNVTPPPRLSRRVLLGGAAAATLSGLLRTRSVGARTESTADRIERIIRGLSIAEKAAQLFVIGAAGTSMWSPFHDFLGEIKPGGVLFFTQNIGTATELRNFVKAIHDSNRALPPLIAIDQEGGPVTRIAGDPAPGAVELGTQTDKMVRQKARERAEFLAGFGFDVNFAPVADVAYKPTSYMAARSFGADPGLVAAKVRDFVRGSRAGGMAGAAKHFPGHGRTSIDSHLALPEVTLSLPRWKQTDSLPFAAAVAAGVEMVMIGHLSYPKWDASPTSLSHVAVTTLREGLGFGGVIVTDDLGMSALRDLDPFKVLDRAIHAGIDLLLYASPPAPIGDLIGHLRLRIERNTAMEKRIDDSLRRILTMKARRFDLAVPARRE